MIDVSVLGQLVGKGAIRTSRVGMKRRFVHVGLSGNDGPKLLPDTLGRLGANLASLVVDQSDYRSLVGLALLAPDPLVGVTVLRFAADQASSATTTPENRSAPGPWIMASRIL